MKTWIGDRLGWPDGLSMNAPGGWLLLSFAARILRLGRLEAVAVGRALKPAIARVRR